MRHFTPDTVIYDIDGHWSTVRSEYYEFDPLPTPEHQPTQDELDAIQADYYARAITELAHERTATQRAVIMAQVINLPWYVADKQDAARRAAELVVDEIARIEAQITRG